MRQVRVGGHYLEGREQRLWAALVVLSVINFFIISALFAPAQPKQVTIPYTVFKAQVVATSRLATATNLPSPETAIPRGAAPTAIRART